MEVVSFFNHKGGVGKTTLLFNVGLALAKAGKKVLFVDADAQANLTGTALNAEAYQLQLQLEETIYHALLPVIRATGDARVFDPVSIRENAWILPGHILLSEFEEILPAAWVDSLAGRYQGFQRTTALYRLINDLAARVSADYVLIDLGPSVGALNRVVLLGSDGFVVPLAPDLFSLTALPSVGNSVVTWIQEWRVAEASAARQGVGQQLPGGLFKGEPSPLGYISQQFASYRSAPAAAFQRWLDDIPAAYNAEIVDRLRAAGVQVPTGPGQIGTVRNLSSLVPMAQEANAAIFELSGSEARGSQYTRARDTLKDFARLADAIVDRLDEVS
ncbi:ParA family protein [Microbacterium trichothecenolyticum]